MDKIEDPVARDKQLSLKICADINRVLLNALSPTTPHLNEIECDVQPRHEAFWFVGGIDPTSVIEDLRADHPLLEFEMEPTDRPFQYKGE